MSLSKTVEQIKWLSISKLAFFVIIYVIFIIFDTFLLLFHCKFIDTCKIHTGVISSKLSKLTIVPIYLSFLLHERANQVS